MIETKIPEHTIAHVLIGNQHYQMCVLCPIPGETEGEGFLVEEISERTANRSRTRNLILRRLQSLGLKARDFMYLDYNHQLSFVVVRDRPELPLI